jgi:hypothetical protein
VEALDCRARPVAVVGGGNSAGQAALFLARHASCVRVFVRGHDLTENMSRYLIDRIDRNPMIEVHVGTEIRELLGDDGLEAIVVENTRAGERRTYATNHLFVFIGAEPCVGWLAGRVELDDKGYVRTGHDGALPLETNLSGVFAVGDVRSGSIKRVVRRGRGRDGRTPGPRAPVALTRPGREGRAAPAGVGAQNRCDPTDTPCGRVFRGETAHYVRLNSPRARRPHGPVRVAKQGGTTAGARRRRAGGSPGAAPSRRAS